MTDALRNDRLRAPARGDDLGDVLASIRRLIAQDGSGGSPRTDARAVPLRLDPAARSGGPAADAGQDVAQPSDAGRTRSDAPPQAPADELVDAPLADRGTADRLAERSFPPASPARTAALTHSLAEAVDQASARMAETTRRVEAARSPRAAPGSDDPAPFRLRPDALIPPAVSPVPTATQPEPAKRPAARLSLIAPTDADIAGDACTPLGPGTPFQPAPVSQWTETVQDAISQPHAEADEPDLDAGIAARDGTDMVAAGSDDADQAVPGARAHPAPADAAAPSQPLQSQADDGEALPPLTHIIRKEQTLDAHPLRNMLRDAIRDELRGEFADRIDGDLRRIVREELAAALTEAFGRTSA